MWMRKKVGSKGYSSVTLTTGLFSGLWMVWVRAGSQKAEVSWCQQDKDKEHHTTRSQWASPSRPRMCGRCLQQPNWMVAPDGWHLITQKGSLRATFELMVCYIHPQRTVQVAREHFKLASEQMVSTGLGMIEEVFNLNQPAPRTSRPTRDLWCCLECHPLHWGDYFSWLFLQSCVPPAPYLTV